MDAQHQRTVRGLMNFTQDEICAIVGAKELEAIALRKRVADLEATLKELTNTEPKPKDE